MSFTKWIPMGPLPGRSLAGVTSHRAQEVSNTTQTGAIVGLLCLVLHAVAMAAEQPRFTAISRTSGNLNLQWTGGGSLEWAPDIRGPWILIPQSSSPWTTIPAHAPNLFYRVTLPPPTNQAPVVSLTIPTDGATFTRPPDPTHITLNATASDPDGTIHKVEFYWSSAGILGGSGIIGQATTGPYTVVWNDVVAGTFTLTAKAYDNEGMSATSAPVKVTVRNRPILTASADALGNVFVQWTFVWTGGLVSTDDGYELQESTVSGSSGFSTVRSTLGHNDHSSPAQYATPKPAGDYWYRVRARKVSVFSEWSDVVKVTVVRPPSKTRFINQSSYVIISLRVNGQEQFPVAPMGMLPGKYLEMELAPGRSHAYRMVNGFWNTDGSRFEMYVTSGNITPREGTTESVVFMDPTINQLLSRFSTSALWVGDYWDNLVPHKAAFRFYGNGTWRLYVDNSQISSGTYSLVRRNPSAFSVTFTVGDRHGELNEVYGYFTMRNGPPSWPLIQYFYSGSP